MYDYEYEVNRLTKLFEENETLTQIVNVAANLPGQFHHGRVKQVKSHLVAIVRGVSEVRWASVHV